MKTADHAFNLYVEYKLRQHARALRDAAYFRNDVRHAAYLAHAAEIRSILAADIVNHRGMN